MKNPPRRSDQSRANRAAQPCFSCFHSPAAARPVGRRTAAFPLTFLLALMLCLVLAGTVHALAEYLMVDGILYALDTTNQIAEVADGKNCLSEDVSIPAEVEYHEEKYTVTSIARGAFRSSIFLKKVTIPSSVTSIGLVAFDDCQYLQEVEIPSSVTSIGDSAFKSTGLKSVTIPSSVTSIGDSAFDNCSSLTSINVDNDNTNYSSKDGVLFNKLQTALIRFPEGKSGSFNIPGSVSSIEKGAFSGCKDLTSVDIPSSVTDIGVGAFENSGLTSVTIPNSVTSIGKDCFQNCDNLESVTIPESVTIIGEEAFATCDALKSIVIPASVKTIGNNAFYYSEYLSSVIFTSGNVDIASNAFSMIDNCTAYFPANAAIPSGIPGGMKTEIYYMVTVSATNGSVTAESLSNILPASFNKNNTFYYVNNESAAFTAIPQNGYSFVNWTENDVEISTATSYSTTVNRNINLKANFKLQTFTDEFAQLITQPEAEANLEADGSTKDLLSVAGVSEGGTILYSVNGGAWSDAVPQASAEGEYQIRYYIRGDSTHKDNGSPEKPLGTLTVMIAPVVNVDFVFIKSDGTRGVPFDIKAETLKVTLLIKDGDEVISKSGELAVKIGPNEAEKPLKAAFPGKIELKPGKYTVIVSGLPAKMEKDILNSLLPDAEPYKLTAKAEINSKDGKTVITVYLIFNDRSEPDEPVVYALPEDEIGAYVLRADGTKEYLLFHTYGICMAWLGSDNLCSGPERCFHKDGK